MRAIQESVEKSRQAALERTQLRLQHESAEKEARRREEAARLQKERCFQSRRDLIKAMDVAREEDALVFLEQMRGNLDMLVATDEYGSTLLHEACSRGMRKLALAVLEQTKDDQEHARLLFQRDYRDQTPLHRAAAAGNGEICLELCKRKECRIGLKDRDGRTALQVAKHWGFSAAADAIFRAINPLPELQMQVKPPEPEEEHAPEETQAKRGMWGPERLPSISMSDHLFCLFSCLRVSQA
ncbi:unnamed protein product [Effrenium voratum]|uniref:Uncharacterized protein n=1 Tax=Effrenium voratum TaxID=2562239 RepID=A0AA36MYT4_9DINO|nr:unnamed protein product [Effrenium voratum]